MYPNPRKILPDLFVIPNFENEKIEVCFTPPDYFSGAEWRVDSGGQTLCRGRLEETGGEPVTFEAALPGFEPWSVDHPHLYTLRIDVEAGGKKAQETQVFGMTKVESRQRRLFFNRRPFYVRGVIRGREAHDHPNLAGLSEKEYYAKFIRQAKRYGFNFIRFHSRIPPETYFEAADELGMLTHVEIRPYFGKYQKERELADHDPALVKEEEWRETLLRVRNHPSLMVYCLGNEINHPGKNPEVKKIFELTRELDPTRLFIDTCARGEFDRGFIDLDVQHMGYFCPFGRSYSMFDTTRNWGIFGSVSGVKISEVNDPEHPTAETTREIPVNVPVLAHEIGHYAAYRDLDALDRKFGANNAEKPWWLGELRKLLREKGLEDDYPEMLASSKKYQFAWWKQVFESARRSPILSGFHFLQFADTDRYENSNGVVDCFDDSGDHSPGNFLPFNSDTVLLADLPERVFFGKARLEISILLSHYDPRFSDSASFSWALKDMEENPVLQGDLDGFDLSETGLRNLCSVAVTLPELSKPKAFRFSCALADPSGAEIARNAWTVWVFPRPAERARPPRAKIMTVHRFTGAVFQRLDQGGDVLMLYRVPENRDRAAKRERYCLPSTQDRFKGTIWDRGHNLGGFVLPHPAMKEFPHEGHVDFQFSRLIDDADKICLDDFPVPVTPIIQGNDKASRDRFDVFTFKLRELQPGWTLRKFAYLFEVRVGRGRLLVSGFNFTGLEAGHPEVCCLYDSLLRYMRSPKFKPAASVSVRDLSRYLSRKGKAKRVVERMMTQHWQLDDQPLESGKYWKDAEAWVRINS